MGCGASVASSASAAAGAATATTPAADTGMGDHKRSTCPTPAQPLVTTACHSPAAPRAPSPLGDAAVAAALEEVRPPVANLQAAAPSGEELSTPTAAATPTPVAQNFELSQLVVCTQPPPAEYVSLLTAVVENMSGGQQASEASYALGAGGGTKQDSKDEKAFSEMLKGPSDKGTLQMPAVPPHKGTWLRVLNRSSGVYLYVHTETQRVVGTI
jgi:hypothetical protein